MYTLNKRSAVLALAFCISAASSVTAAAQDLTLRVNIDATPTIEDGTTWETAFRFLQDALAEADFWLTHPTDPVNTVEIWLAAGTYRPDHSKDNKDPDHPNPAMQCDPELDPDCCPPFNLFGPS